MPVLENLTGAQKSGGLDVRAALEGPGEVGNCGEAKRDEQREPENLKGMQGKAFGAKETGIGDGQHAAQNQNCPENAGQMLFHLQLAHAAMFRHRGKLGNRVIEDDPLRFIQSA